MTPQSSEFNADAQTLPLPADVPNSYLLFCQLPPHAVPTPDSLRPMIKTWMAQNLNPPLLAIVPSFFDMPFMSLIVADKRQMPAEMINELQTWNSAEAFAGIQRATHCIIARSPDPLIFPRSGLWACLASGLACAQRFGGVLIDADTQRSVPTDIPFSRLHAQGLLHIRYFINVPMSQDEQGLFWMTTRGMVRFGLPEIQVENIPPINLEQLVWVVCGVCQHLAGRVLRLAGETGELQKSITLAPDMTLTWTDMQLARGAPPEDPLPEGCSGEARLRLTMQLAQRAPQQRFLTLLPPADETRDYGAWLHSLVHAFFLPEDTLNRDSVDEEAMQQAHQQALETLPDVKRRWQNGSLGNRHLGLKRPFPVEGGGNEYLWIAVTSWKGDRIEGQLTNTPQRVTGLQSGQSVSFTENEIYDWLIQHPDGTLEGGFTNALLTRPPQETAAAPEPETPEKKEKREREIRLHYREYVNEIAQSRGARRTGCTPWPVALARSLFGSKPAPKRDPVQDQLAEQGRLVIAYVVMANTMLMSPGEGDAPCLAIFTFDEGPGDNDFLIDLVERLMSLKGTTPTEPDLREAAVLVNDEAYVPYRRRRVPPGLTGGRVIYAVDLRIRRARLPGGYLQMPILPCLAMPGDTGAIELLPSHLWQLIIA